MKIVIQRVKKSFVKVDGNIISEIGEGLLVFLAVAPFDTKKDVSYLALKLLNLRMFPDNNQKMNISIKDNKKEILVVSQFTLYADLKKGNRPSFTKAAEPSFAKDLYEYFVEEIKKENIEVKKGSFGEKMEVYIINDGPCTFILETEKK